MTTFAEAAWSRTTLQAPICPTYLVLKNTSSARSAALPGGNEARCLRLGLLLGLLREKDGVDVSQ